MRFKVITWRGPEYGGDQGTLHYEVEREPPKNCGLQPHGFTLAELRSEVEAMLIAVQEAEERVRLSKGGDPTCPPKSEKGKVGSTGW